MKLAWIVPAAAGVVIAVAAGALVFARLDEGPSVSRSNSPPGPYRGSEPPAGISAPDFQLRSQRGELVRMRALRGRVVVLTFLESRCKEACPIIARQIGQGLDLLVPAQRRLVVAIAISTHPEDDTIASVRTFLRRHGVESKLRYLIGSERELRPVWESFHILSALESGDADTHSAPVRVYDPAGEWVSTLHPGVDLTPANLAHDIRLALDR